MTFKFTHCFAIIVALAAPLLASAQNPPPEERFVKPSNELVDREEKYWKRVSLPIPDEIVLETSGMVTLPDKRLLVTTRRGELWIIEGAYAKKPSPTFSLFASGLHEPLGIAQAPSGGYYVAQRQEITHIEDTDGDWVADSFKTVAKLPLSGSYHEYAYGPVMAPNGNMRVTLNVAFRGSTQAPVPWRGWMMEVTPDGQMIPIAAGLRSPAGFTVTSDGLWLFSENQGEWVGSGRVTQVDEGDFTGHMASLQWTKLPGSPVSLRPGDVDPQGDPMHEVAKRVEGVKPPAVWFPHTVLGISTAGIEEDQSDGEFGPFAGQFFVGDQGQSKIMRMTLEKVKGVWQGASYAFREGFECGIIRLAMGEDGTLFAGQTSRGWGSVGEKSEGMARLVWTGKMPFEIKEVTAQPDGFLLTFTKPVERETAADLANYRVSSFTYKYHSNYGSPPVYHQNCPVLKVEVADDGLSARIAVAYLREGYVHEIKASGVREKASGETLLHDTAYYTLNQLPYGKRILPLEPELCGVPSDGSTSAPTSDSAAASEKNPTEAPASWNENGPEVTFSFGTVPGLKFDKTLLEAKTGQRIRLSFANVDDMLHNVVICKPGTGQTVGNAAMQLGVAGMSMHFVPESEDVLYHTTLIDPEHSESIYFTAPSKPGDYDFVCTFPGHASLMRGILRVRK